MVSDSTLDVESLNDYYICHRPVLKQSTNSSRLTLLSDISRCHSAPCINFNCSPRITNIEVATPASPPIESGDTYNCSNISARSFGCTHNNDLKTIRAKKLDRIIIAHLNINSIRNKFIYLHELVKDNIDILFISEVSN